MSASVRPRFAEVTPRVSPSLVVPTITVPDFDVVAGRARAAADRFLGRDCEQIARFSGLSVHAVRSLRDAREDQIPSVAKVALVAFGGRMIGRDYSQVADFLSPISEAAAGEFVPSGESGEVKDISTAAASCLREASEAIAAAIEATRDAKITSAKCIEFEHEIEQAISALHDLKHSVRTATREVIDVIPARGRKFSK